MTEGRRELIARLKNLQRWYPQWNGAPLGWIKASDVWDLIHKFEAALAEAGRQEPVQTAEKFIAWVERTPNKSLIGDSRVAYDAQVSVLRQLRWYLQGGDEALNAAVDWQSVEASRLASPHRS